MGKKCELDKFYTKHSVVQKIISRINYNDYDLIIEPSAGGGAFIDNISPDKTTDIVGLDIAPESSYIIQQDWFEYSVPENYQDVLIIGNPPFGSRNNLSKNFIKHALSFENVKTIAFILPNVFHKHTNQAIFPRNWQLIEVIELERNSFLLNNKDYHVPCSFFIWTKKPNSVNLRFKPENYQSHPHFDIVKKDDDFDFFVMGASPKVIKEKHEVNKNNRGYCLKSHIDVQKLKNNIQSINWSKHGYSSANGGVSWFSKPEFIKVYSDYF